MHEALSMFHPVIQQWFVERVGSPTDVQAAAWPVIAAGKNAFITAPTGSGKTLTAFLWALDRLLTRQWPGGQIRVVYVSPLKALNNDIQRNLLSPLAELRPRFEAAGQPCPEVRVFTRSGDTEQSERRRMLSRPPEILITTPESLNLLLSSPKAQRVLSGIQTVILDEVHFVAATKRGTHLITAVDRLVRLSGEFQRVALSATIKPVEAIAEFVAGYEMHGHGGQPRYEKRPIEVVQSDQTKDYAVTVRFLGQPEHGPAEDPGRSPFWNRTADALKTIVRRNESTLLFTNSRRLCERLSYLMNRDEEAVLAYAHHGSLSRELRGVVEQRLKQGDLKAIVATSSLELGIDIGALDEVVLVQTPASVSSAVQRVGRAGHQVGAVSRGTLFPTLGRDLIEAAVMARNIVGQDIESVRPVACPLDVLAQVIVSMTGIEPWDLDRLYAFLQTTWPYRHLSRTQFDLVVDMLAGRYQESRLRALQPLVSVDRLDNTMAGRPMSLRVLYSSGGTIPDRGYFTLRHAATNAKIGELDEEFVWERSVGDTLALGLQSWRVQRITHNDVLVEPAPHRLSDVPFWRAEEIDRGFHAAEKIALFLEAANDRLDDPEFPDELRAEHFMETEAAEALAEFLKRQRSATRADLPHRRHVLIEHFADHDTQDECTRVMLHTLWGGRVNRPFALALAQAWEDRFHERIEVSSNNDGVFLLLPGHFEKTDLFSLVEPEAVEALLREKLEQTGFFGARFRENAARALLLPRQSFNKRMPLWLNRQRSKRLLQAASRYEDFPILVETWRTCLRDEFDLPTLDRLLGEIRDGRIRCSETRTPCPSPFVANALWRLTNQLMYADDTPVSGQASKLSDDLLQEAVFSHGLRPPIPEALRRSFEQKAQRVFPGYAPDSPQGLLDWVKERLLIPEPEWEELLAAVERDHAAGRDEVLGPVAHKLARLTLPGDRSSAVVALESLPRAMQALGLPDPAPVVLNGEPVSEPLQVPPGATPEDEADPLADWLGEWLRCYGPMTKEAVLAALPLDEARLEEALEALSESQSIVRDPHEFCDSENMEILIRLARAAARPAFEPLPLAQLPLFLALHQGIGTHAEGPERIHRALETLFGYPIPAALLESEFLPARLDPYAPALLDEVMNTSDLAWFGIEGRKVLLSFAFNRDLISEAKSADGDDARAETDLVARLFADEHGRYDFDTLLKQDGLSVTELTERLWQLVWEGRITNDSFAALRKGIETGFTAAEGAGPARTSQRRRFQAWKSARAYPGNWHVLPPVDADPDAMDREELNKERVRVLLDRYGVLFRELLAQELPALRWGALFRTLRLMELAGEVLAGCFFEGVPGLQFISHEAFREVQQPLDEDAVFWLNATDPASVCGVGLDDLKGQLPKRLPTTHLVYRGPRLVVVSKRNGKQLDIRVPPGDPHIERYFAFLQNALARAVAPLRSVSVETINGEPAPKSPYLSGLREWFDASADWKKVTLWRRT